MPVDVNQLLQQPSSSPSGANTLARLYEFAQRYTAAWCSQKAASVAAFFSREGSLSINDGPAAVGHEAITEVAQSFMTAFPDMRVLMDGIVVRGNRAVYPWTLVGTNNGPGGTGNKVHFSGFEVWTIGPDGLIAQSLGYFDNALYQHQLEHGPDGL